MIRNFLLSVLVLAAISASAYTFQGCAKVSGDADSSDANPSTSISSTFFPRIPAQ